MSPPTTVTGPAPAKINLALVVGPSRPDGKHEIVTVMQRLELADTVTLRPSSAVLVAGFPDDTLVTRALDAIRERTGASFAATIRKEIPVASGLGGGSSDAATALRLANGLLERPLEPAALHAIAAGLGSDVPFFLEDGAQLAVSDGSVLTPQPLPQDYVVLLALPHGAVKTSTADVYAAFDARAGRHGFDERRESLRSSLASVRVGADLALLPRNDLAASPLADHLERLGAFRADVSGAGPVVYGLFASPEAARAAQDATEEVSRTWITAPRWYR